eukprot:8615407-Pyramimonas_sp.AAC.2
MPLVRQLACGNKHAAALLSTGELFMWGLGDDGQLGGGGFGSEAAPTPVKLPHCGEVGAG